LFFKNQIYETQDIFSDGGGAEEGDVGGGDDIFGRVGHKRKAPPLSFDAPHLKRHCDEAQDIRSLPTACQPTGFEQPPAQPTGFEQPLAQPTGSVPPPAQPTGSVPPPAQPTGFVPPPAQQRASRPRRRVVVPVESSGIS